MVRSVVFIACFVLIFTSSLCSEQNVEVTVVGSLSEYLRENPNVKLLQPLVKDVSKTKDVSQLILITYRLGNRINGDRLVATASGNNNWNTAQDVSLTLTYPKTGTGSVVTYIQIPVEQSSNLGQGYVIDGGIGQRKIVVVIEAKSTLYFKYSAEIFGY